jgi:protein phosphatase
LLEMHITIPNLSLVVLIGPSGSGKSTFARQHFQPTEVLSSDFCRGLVSDDENDQAATGDAFEVLHFVAAKRLRAGKLTVIDATNVQPESRQPLVALAKAHDVLPVAIVLNLPERLCHDRNAGRADRSFGPHVIRNQISQLRRSLKHLSREGFRKVFVLNDPAEVSAATLERQPVWNDLRHERGPFDIIGDVHGCADELEELLGRLGYDAAPGGSYVSPAGRKLVFLGDLVDRGPKSPEVVRLVMESVRAGTALCVPGNHDVKFMRHTWGKKVAITHGLAESIEQFTRYESHYHGFARVAAEFIDSLVSHYVLDGGNLVVAHAGMKAEYQGRTSGRVREFALYGETTGETDEFGLPVRLDWAADYRGRAMVVYGHTPVPEPEWLNHTINIDTGCVFGGRLTALRYPERELVSVPARQVYCEPVRPLVPPQPAAVSAQQAVDDVLDVADCLGKRLIETRLAGRVTIRAEQSAAALEVMSRFAANPKWLIYLPPTMSPCETAAEGRFLEHPEQVLAYYREAGVECVICQEKHMGSRAVVIVCRDDDAMRRRFGVTGEGSGIIYTRTGRRFFDDSGVESRMLDLVRQAATRAGWWERFTTDWLCLDCELMPWSAKAQELLRQQYAAVGVAAEAGLRETETVLELAAMTRTDLPADVLGALMCEFRSRRECVGPYRDVYARYCWPVRSVEDLRLAPFHLLAAEGQDFTHQDHAWHMQTLGELAGSESPVMMATRHLAVELNDAEACTDAVRWWEELTAAGGEGMVVKPLEWIVKNGKGLVQPAIKCRGREYLRIIYGPEYTLPQHLGRLRNRSTRAKRSLAVREFALGLEALQRFIHREPLRRVHECVFGVLALESEPVDPRL